MFELQIDKVFFGVAREAKAAMKHREKERTELLENIAKTKLELETASDNFSFVTDPLLVDMYAYQIKAAQAKYSYLLRKARKMGITQHDYVKKSSLGRISGI